VFCSVTCWEIHLPTANHREAWAVERTAPSQLEPDPPAPAVPGSGGAQPRRRLVRPPSTQAPLRGSDDEVLIIASRLKDYVRTRSGFNTSDRVLEPLSELVRRACDRAIERARREGRKTVLDRDLPDS